VLGRLREFGSGARLTRRFRAAGSDDRLHWNLRARCYVRRTKRQVLPQLPAKRHDTVPVLLSNEQEYRLAEQDVVAWLQSLPLDLRTIDAKVAAALRAEQLVRLNNLRQLAVSGKLPTALAWIGDFMASGEPLVVFAEHIATQRAVLERFPDAVHILGSDTSQARQQAVDAFQSEDGPQLIVCALKAASQGITLTRASNVAFLELDWTPARHDQAEDRLHRIGQESAVTAWYLLAPDTIDETMAALLERKRGLIDAVTDGQVREEERLVDAVVRELRGRPFRHLRVVA
jgi:SWI/SNF-related matrix-associated actin-dependent regulator of chromatin subfamily A-like protein 1